MQFSEHLRALRSSRGLGIKQLAPALGVTYSYISKLENNGAQPSAGFVEKVSSYFECDQSDLLLSAGHVPPDIVEILKTHPQDAVQFLREHFGGGDDARPEKD
jgi:transcriptional regulator with XRE-family HTH domain